MLRGYKPASSSREKMMSRSRFRFVASVLPMTLFFRSPLPIGGTKVKWAYLCLWFVLSVAIWLLLRGTGPQLQLSIDLQSPQAGAAQLFCDRGQGYSERESITSAIKAGPNHIEFTLPPGPIVQLRLDPVNSGAPVSVSRIQIRRGGSSPWVALSLDAWQPTGATVIKRSDGVLALVADATTDPQVQFVPTEPLNQVVEIADQLERCIIALLLAFAAVLLLRNRFTAPLRTVGVVVPTTMACAGALILAMAVTSTTTRSVHPDEYSHLGAYQYYENHWLPPAADDPATIPSTSIWGYTYLFELDVVYDIAAHVTSPFTVWTQDGLRSARMFQVGLWLILCVLALCRRHWAWVLCVVLLSPQIWYVFAYFNADAFALFLSLIAAGLIADQDSGLHRFLISGDKRGPALWVAAACIGLLLVSKRNYLPVVPAFLLSLAVLRLGLGSRAIVMIVGGLLLEGIAAFLGDVPAMAVWKTPMMLAGFLLTAGTAGYLFWKYWKDIQKRKILLRLSGFVLICLLVAVPRFAWDVHVNGSPAHKAEAVRAVVEARAGPNFKPSAVAAGKGESTLALAARGVPLQEVIFAPGHWAYRSLISAFGVYGYMDVFAPTWLYVCLSVLTFLALVVALASLRRGNSQWLAMAATVIGCAALIVSSSLMLSWVDQLQPQGRYLLPVFPLMALLFGLNAEPNSRRLAGAIVMAAALLSLGSFAFIALPPLAVP